MVQKKVTIVAKIKSELVDNCNAKHRIIMGGRGKGASWSIARVLLMEAIKEKLFIVCVREIQKSIEYSVQKLLVDQIKELDFVSFFKIEAKKIIGINGSLFVFQGVQDHTAESFKSFEGADRCWVAEAQSISRRSISIIRPTLRKQGCVIWWDFNPRYATDPIYVDYVVKKNMYAKYAIVCKVNWRDNPWFNESLRLEMEADYARDAVEAEHIWGGVLRDASDKFVCPMDLVDAAMNRKIAKLNGAVVVGADIAHQGGDGIVFYKRIGYKVVDKYYANKQNTQTTVHDLIRFLGDRSVVLVIDNGYIGASVADLIEEDGYIVHRINFGGTPRDAAHYEDCATEMYFNLSKKLPLVEIPFDEDLRAELIQRKYKHINGRRGYEVMKIESKLDFKKHASTRSASPDSADAMALCFYFDDADIATGRGETFDPGYNIY